MSNFDETFDFVVVGSGGGSMCCALALRAATREASPNRRFVAMADAELGRGGRMSRAIERIGRGGTWLEIGEARAFSIPSHYA